MNRISRLRSQLYRLAVRVVDSREPGESLAESGHKLWTWFMRGRRRGHSKIDASDIWAVARLLRSGKIAYGAEVQRFQAEFARIYGARHGVCSTSGTAAVHVALAMVDIQPGDEVIVPPITDMGTILPILACNAIPVVADVDPDSWNLDPAAVERCITPQTKAVIAVHLFGNPCDMDGLLSLREQHGFRLIEDCAQAHWAAYGGRPIGTLGDVGAFSLQWTKHITTGEGGVTITNDSALAERGRLFVDKGWNRGAPPGARQYPIFGLNYRMSEMQAALGRSQLRRARTIVERRHRNAQRVMEELEGLPVRFQQVPEGSRHAYWQLALTVEPDAPFTVDALAPTLSRQHKIGCAAHYIGRPIHLCHEPLVERRLYRDSELPFSLSPRAAELDYRAMETPEAQRVLDRLAILSVHDEFSSEAAVVADAKEIRKVIEKLSDPALMQPKPDAHYTVAVVGCGKIAAEHLEAIAQIPSLKVVAAADLDANARKTVASRFGVPTTYDDYQEMLEKERPDILLVLLWPTLHAEVTEKALQRGVRAVLCEKPIASDLGEARKMLQAADSSGSRLMIGHQHRFNPHLEEARRLIADGEIGTVRHAWAHCFGALINNGPHVVDGLLYMLGEPEPEWILGQVHREPGRSDRGQPVEAGSLGTVCLAGGIRATIEMGDTAVPEIGWHFYGDLGKIDVAMGHLDVVGRRHKRVTRIERPRIQSMQRQHEEVAECLDDSARPHRGDARHGYAALEVVIGLLESARTREVVRTPVAQLGYPLGEEA